jgi:3-deoxy-manno-octulosonate cytidylyltransferase (CMP-KDO synthetase)
VGFDVLIPARLAATRLPRKPLLDIAGLPMIVRVAKRAALSNAASVVVAADHAEIVEVCRAHGVEAVLTRQNHASGSDRLGEACELLGLDGAAIVVNVQGDEPLIDPAAIDACASLLESRADCVMSTAAHAIDRRAEFEDPNVVKVVLDRRGCALYFSRAPIPHARDAPRTAGDALAGPRPLRHLGLYAYRVGFLRAFAQLSPSPLEQTESLEQLRVLWHGHRIAVHICKASSGPGIDTQQDLDAVRQLLALDPSRV